MWETACVDKANAQSKRYSPRDGTGPPGGMATGGVVPMHAQDRTLDRPATAQEIATFGRAEAAVRAAETVRSRMDRLETEGRVGDAEWTALRDEFKDHIAQAHSLIEALDESLRV